jgi:hypothetical protein
MLEGLRPRLDHVISVPDAGAICDAARHALDAYQWLVTPDFDREGTVIAATQSLADFPAPAGELPRVARWLRSWLQQGGKRLPARAALVRFWVSSRLLPAELPLTAPSAFSAEAPWDAAGWQAAFFHGLAAEADAMIALISTLERAWMAARTVAVRGRRSGSHAGAAVDLLAATPLISATTMASGLGITVKSAIVLLDDLVRAEVAVEVTHRSARRLFGMTGMAPLRTAVQGPYRPVFGRRRGRPVVRSEAEPPSIAPTYEPVVRIEHPAFDYSALDAAMAAVDETIRKTRTNLAALQASWKSGQAI